MENKINMNSKRTLCERRFVQIKLHYFLRLSGTSTIIYLLPLILRQKGISERLVGILWAILRFIALICNLISGPLADILKAHRSVFLFSLVILTTGLNSLYFIPPLPNVGIISPQASETFNLTTTEATSPNFTSQNEILLKEHISLSDSGLTENHDNTTIILDNSKNKTEESLVTYLSYPAFWIIVVCLLLEQVGVGICKTIADVVCFKILDTEPHKYGQQRLWGTIGTGTFALITGAIIDYWSVGKPTTDYTPAYIVCGVFLLCDIIVIARINIPHVTTPSSSLKVSSINNILLSSVTIIFLVTVTVGGIANGTVWTFKLLLVEDVSLAWNPEFASLKLLQGLLLSCETFGAELPFFFLAGSIIKKLGSNVSFTVCLAAQGLRCIGYYLVSNPWYFLIIEFLQGPAFGLFHTNMVAYANHIAPVEAQATFQSVVVSCFTIGTCFGNFLGGLMYHEYGASLMFLYQGLGILAYMAFYVVSQIVVSKYIEDANKVKGKGGYTSPAEPLTPVVPRVSVQELRASHSSIVAVV